ncbi:EexN family lipoprotein [Pseudomonas aeruginosa]|uniref:EexN family lipoprotein n=1 Tax=Pseudomonas aeruginosa TaxID=287 RepID=UPI002753313E|nr:EexN family lipoprotein [Pseudomonas aeruginosa]MED5476583.1 EexN family lipoprotein [Pseudomonadota bacterium]
MKKVTPFLCVLAITSCGQPAAPAPLALPTVDELAADPVRLKELRQQCKLDRAKLGDELCNRVAEATRKCFYSDGNVPYTPPKEPSKF